MGGYVFFSPLLEGREKRMAVLLRRAILHLALFAKYRYEGDGKVYCRWLRSWKPLNYAIFAFYGYGALKLTYIEW